MLPHYLAIAKISKYIFDSKLQLAT